MLASSATASPSFTISAAARAIARFALDLEAHPQIEADLRLTRAGAPARRPGSARRGPAGQLPEVAPDGDLRNGKRFRKFRNLNVISRLEQPEHMLHPLLLRQIR